MSLVAFARVLRAAADEVDRIEAESRNEHRDWIDQRSSPLGPKRHCGAVRRRLAAAQGGAAHVGRRHLLSAEALAEELARLSAPRRAAGKEGVGSELRRALSLVGGGR